MNGVNGTAFGGDESELSSAPEDVVAVQTEVLKVKPAKPRKGKKESSSNEALVSGETQGGGRKTKSTTTTIKRTKKVQLKTERAEEIEGVDGTDELVVEQAPSKKRKRATKVKVQEEIVEEKAEVEKDQDGEVEVKEVKKKVQRTKKQKVEDMTPLEERTEGIQLRVGAHVSISGG
jgi:AP endonuclease-1